MENFNLMNDLSRFKFWVLIWCLEEIMQKRKEKG